MNNLKHPNDFNQIMDDSSEDSISLTEIFNQIMIHKYIVIASTVICFILAILYAVVKSDIYESTTVLKIEQPSGSILSGGMFDEIMNSQNDRYIANEIELLNSYTIREFVANTMIDSFNASNDTNNFYLIMNRDYFGDEPPTIQDRELLVELFSKKVEISQKRGLDFIEISVESPSKKEAMLMANAYADVYLDYNLHENRRQLSNITDFLKEQINERYRLLTFAEDTLKTFRLMAGVVELGAQSTQLIETIADFETKKNTAEMELAIAKKTLSQYKGELARIDPTVKRYLDSQLDESYIKELQEQIASIEGQRDVAVAGGNITNKKLLEAYDSQLLELKSKLNNHVSGYQDKLMSSSSPQEVKLLTQLIFEEEVKVQALTASLNQLNSILKTYDTKFGSLPEATLELARLERNKIALEKLYMVLEEKYHEAMINEQSIPGNVIVIDKAKMPLKPSKPNRKLIVLIGIFLGTGIGIGIVYLIGFFSSSIKTPEDIQHNQLKLLGWVPQFNESKIDTDFIVKENPKSIAAESYRAIRTRIQFSKEGKEQIKTILVTSALPEDGKTTTAVNIAGSFALADKKVVLIGADLRKPRMNKLFNVPKIPGLVDYFKKDAKLEEILHKTDVENLFFIPAGTIPSNPSELLGSHHIEDFLEVIKPKVDIIVIDSAPLLPVTDTELLSKIVDACILVVSSGRTEKATMLKAAELLQETGDNFIGAVLNNFGDKYTNNSYYKYYYYYQNSKTLDNVSPFGKTLKKVYGTKKEEVEEEV